jgi:DNA-binding NarL/FixJ family response regulator
MAGRPKSPKFNILVVDDKPPVLEAMARMTKRVHEDIVIIKAASCAEAEALLNDASREIHGLLADDSLGDGFGMDLLRMLRKRKSNVVVAIYTGWPDGRDNNEADDLGAQYFVKPVEAKNVLNFVHRVFMNRPIDVGPVLDASIEEFGFTEKQTEVVASGIESTEHEDLRAALGLTESALRTRIRGVLNKARAKFPEWALEHLEELMVMLRRRLFGRLRPLRAR